MNEGDEELTVLMNKWGGVYDVEVEADELHLVLEIELELAMIADRAEQHGIEDGRRLQARLEEMAMNLDNLDAREGLLEQAVLRMPIKWMRLVMFCVVLDTSVTDHDI